MTAEEKALEKIAGLKAELATLRELREIEGKLLTTAQARVRELEEDGEGNVQPLVKFLVIGAIFFAIFIWLFARG